MAFRRVMFGFIAVIVTLLVATLAMRSGAKTPNQVLVERASKIASQPRELSENAIEDESDKILAAVKVAAARHQELGPTLEGLAHAYGETLRAYRAAGPERLLRMYDRLGLMLPDQQKSQLKASWTTTASLVSGRRINLDTVRVSILTRNGDMSVPLGKNQFRRWPVDRGDRDVNIQLERSMVYEVSVDFPKPTNGIGPSYRLGIGFARRPSDGEWLPVVLTISDASELPVILPFI